MKLASLEERGLTPRDVMLDNMLFWVKRAQLFDKEEMRLRLEAAQYDEVELEHLDEDGQKEYRSRMGRARSAAAHALGELKQAIDRSQSCAAQAAQYCHPRLHAVDITSAGEPLPAPNITINLVQPGTSAHDGRLVEHGKTIN